MYKEQNYFQSIFKSSRIIFDELMYDNRESSVTTFDHKPVLYLYYTTTCSIRYPNKTKRTQTNLFGAYAAEPRMVGLELIT